MVKNNSSDYRIKKIRKMDKFEMQAIVDKINDYLEKNKQLLLFKTTAQICKDLKVSHYKYKFYLEIYQNYLNG